MGVRRGQTSLEIFGPPFSEPKNPRRILAKPRKLPANRGQILTETFRFRLDICFESTLFGQKLFAPRHLVSIEFRNGISDADWTRTRNWIGGFVAFDIEPLRESLLCEWCILYHVCKLFISLGNLFVKSHLVEIFHYISSICREIDLRI